jgi:hypothetical protein
VGVIGSAYQSKLLNKEGVLWDFLIIKICKFLTAKIRILADLSKGFAK